MRLGERAARPAGVQGERAFQDQSVWGRGSEPRPLPADVPSHHCPKKQGREGGSTIGETESGEFFAEAPLAPMHLKTLLTTN